MKKKMPRSLCKMTAHVRDGRVGERVPFDHGRGSARGREGLEGRLPPERNPRDRCVCPIESVGPKWFPRRVF